MGGFVCAVCKSANENSHKDENCCSKRKISLMARSCKDTKEEWYYTETFYVYVASFKATKIGKSFLDF